MGSLASEAVDYVRSTIEANVMNMVPESEGTEVKADTSDPNSTKLYIHTKKEYGKFVIGSKGKNIKLLKGLAAIFSGKWDHQFLVYFYNPEESAN